MNSQAHQCRTASRFWSALLIALVIVGGTACANVFKKPFTPEQDVSAALRATESAVQVQDWAQASNDWDRLQTAWTSMEARIRLNADESDFTGFERSLEKLKAAIEIEDESAARLEIAEMKVIWEELAKF